MSDIGGLSDGEVSGASFASGKSGILGRQRGELPFVSPVILYQGYREEYLTPVAPAR